MSLISCLLKSKSSNNILESFLLASIFFEHTCLVIAKPRNTSDLNELSLSILTLIKSFMFIEDVKH